MAGAVDTADSPLGGSWRDFPSLLKASVLDMPTRVRGAQGCTKIHPWMQCQITGRSQKTGKLGGVNIAYFPNPRACCMAWDICHRWQVLHDQAGKKTGSYNFADAGYEADDKLTALLQEVPTVQQAASLVRKQLLVPPPMPADKRRALTSRGGERLRLPHIGPRARPSSRFTLAADRTLKLHLAGDVYKRKRLLFKDHFFKHVWGGSQPVAAGPQQQQQQQRQQAATAEGDGEDEGSEDGEEGSDGEQGSEDEGAAAGRLCRPRPAPLWLITAEGQEVAIAFNRAGKDGWCAKWAELKELLDLLQVTEDDVEQRSLVFQPHASGGAASRPGFLQAAVRLELKAEPQQAASGGAAAAAAAAAGKGAATAATEDTGERTGAAAAGTAAPEGAAAAAAVTEDGEAQAPAAVAAVALERQCAAGQVHSPEQQQQQQPTTPDAAAALPQPPPPSSGETSHGEAPAPNLRLLMRRLLKRKPGTSSGGEDAQVQQAQQQQADPAELAGAGSKRPAEKADAARAEVAKSGQPASKRPRHAQQPQPPPPPPPPPPPQQQQQPQPLPQHAQQQQQQPQPLPQHAQQQPQPQPQRAQQQQQQQQQEAEVVDLTMSSDDEDEELDIVGPPGRPAAYAQPPARPVQQAGLGGRGGAAGGMCAGGSTAAPPAPATAAAPGPAAAAAAAGSAGRLGKAERYVAVMSRLQGAGVTGEAYKAASDRYRALPDILRSMWHSRFMAAADGAAVQQAVAELLGGAPGGAHA